MGLDAVVAEIREKGQAQADTIRKEADAKKAEILNTAQQKAESIRTSVRDEVAKTSSQIIAQEEAAGHLVVKRQILNTQKELMDDVHRQALEKINAMPESFHKEAISSLLRKAGTEIPAGKVSCCARDETALKEVLKDAVFSAYSFGSVIGIDGGIIVESADGQLQVDFSYRTFMSQVWESGLKDASDILFA
jgi:V/A-type H+/Na+-transporting ATPase subunit E